MKVICKTEEDTINLGIKIGKKLKEKNVIALEGMLGAGKTTLVKGIASALKIKESITSPTYTIINEYFGKKNLYHMDLYRLNSTEELEMIGIEDMIYSKHISIIEWSKKAEKILPKNCIYINIDIDESENRIFTLKGIKI